MRSRGGNLRKSDYKEPWDKASTHRDKSQNSRCNNVGLAFFRGCFHLSYIKLGQCSHLNWQFGLTAVRLPSTVSGSVADNNTESVPFENVSCYVLIRKLFGNSGSECKWLTIEQNLKGVRPSALEPRASWKQMLGEHWLISLVLESKKIAPKSWDQNASVRDDVCLVMFLTLPFWSVFTDN